MTNAEAGAPVQVHLEDICQIAVSVSDLARSKEFYQNVLGMRFLFDTGPMSFFLCGGIRFAIGTADKAVSPGGTIVYFRVREIQETCRLLTEKGVELIQTPHLVAKMADHDLWLAFLRDPDANTIGLMCEVARTPESEA